MRLFLSETVGGLPRTFWAIFSALLVNRVGAFAMLLLPTYLTTVRGTSLAVAGLVTGAYGAGGVVGTLLGGVLADRWGRRKSYLAGTSTAAVLMLALGFARPVWLIATLAVLVGLAHMLPSAPMVAAIVDVTPEPDRPRAFNLQFWAFNMGMAAAGALAGLIAEVSFFALFAADAAMTALTAVLVWRLVPETRPAAVKAVVRQGLGVVFRDRVFLTFVGLTFALAVLTVQSTSTVQLAMASDGLRPSEYGLVVSVSGALIVLGQLFVPRMIAGLRFASALAVALGLIGFGYFGLMFADAAWVYLVAAIVWTFGQMIGAPPNASIIAQLAPAHLRGRYQAVFSLVFPLAFFVAPAAGGWSLGAIGAWHWLICGLLGGATAVGHLLAAGPRDRHVAAVTTAVPERRVSLEPAGA
ncbi:MFS transporter [Allorhizocola rhizosphaerae]|uniref:MFS transporter n=1 Tax=Allorhizocola rhizosphaerae TaxID=1872709 RepID=UPI000E3DEF70|nr:MFS transporter [Allorhizocola rhizosphaerae]